ncbi:MAG: ParB/RepB/Spo0J family partition protein [Candidatus Pacebacteria bacterium]|nr:ParB/RepB/Spo0J family partition protein [Candidatus Paceibacterota bacterium]
MTDSFYNNSIFWVEVEKVHPNPYQPRKEFDEARLSDLADSIRQYGVLQPLVVTRYEIEKEDGGLATEYELIAGERRLRASRLAGLAQVPVLIRAQEDSSKAKLELAIIENLQREDLNPVDRARAFRRLADEFKLKHTEIGKKVGKSREYVSNTLRLLTMPEEMQVALAEGKITEGHTRPILMLSDKEDEQHTLFKEILYKKLTVREAESIARRAAQNRVRKREYTMTPELLELENQLTERLGTRVQIEKREAGGRVHIDYFTLEDLRAILEKIEGERTANGEEKGFLSRLAAFAAQEPQKGETTESREEVAIEEQLTHTEASEAEELPIDDRTAEEQRRDEDEDLYSVKNFSI